MKDKHEHYICATERSRNHQIVKISSSVLIAKFVHMIKHWNESKQMDYVYIWSIYDSSIANTLGQYES